MEAKICRQRRAERGGPDRLAIQEFDWNTPPPPVPSPPGSAYAGGYGVTNDKQAPLSSAFLCLVAPTPTRPGHADVFRFLDGKESFRVGTFNPGTSVELSRVVVRIDGVSNVPSTCRVATKGEPRGDDTKREPLGDC